MGSEGFERELKITETLSEGRYKIIPLNHRKMLGWASDVAPYDLDRMYRDKDPHLMVFYACVEKICKENHVDVFFVDHECMYHPDFILEMSRQFYTVIYSGDDPESSYRRSKPYMYAFDHAFCYGVYHNDRQKMTEKFLEWGAKRADLRPYGCMDRQYDHTLTEQDIIDAPRPIDIVFIGGRANKRRKDILLSLKDRYRRRFKLYGDWGGTKSVISSALHGHGLHFVKKLDADMFLPVYRQSKIGFNIHQSFGPCNLRLYELPMNGIMQICDNRKGLAELYEIGREVVAYDTLNDAIEMLEYYLAHDAERIQIALNGYRKAKSKYLFHITFYDAMEKIKAGMAEKKMKL
jgi:spore maturation protein CgeB